MSLGTFVIYRDSKGHDKLAQVIGTSEQTAGRIPEGEFSLLVTSPLSGRQYQRNASPDGTMSDAGMVVMTRTAKPSPVAESDGPLDADGTEDAGPFPDGGQDL